MTADDAVRCDLHGVSGAPLGPLVLALEEALARPVGRHVVGTPAPEVDLTVVLEAASDAERARIDAVVGAWRAAHAAHVTSWHVEVRDRPRPQPILLCDADPTSDATSAIVARLDLGVLLVPCVFARPRAVLVLAPTSTRRSLDEVLATFGEAAAEVGLVADVLVRGEDDLHAWHRDEAALLDAVSAARGEPVKRAPEHGVEDPDGEADGAEEPEEPPWSVLRPVAALVVPRVGPPRLLGVAEPPALLLVLDGPWWLEAVPAGAAPRLALLPWPPARLPDPLGPHAWRYADVALHPVYATWSGAEATAVALALPTASPALAAWLTVVAVTGERVGCPLPGDASDVPWPLDDLGEVATLGTLAPSAGGARFVEREEGRRLRTHGDPPLPDGGVAFVTATPGAPWRLRVGTARWRDGVGEVTLVTPLDGPEDVLIVQPLAPSA